jgi:hypothetical protein
MLRGLHLAILRNAALFVPAPERAEWFAEWRAELWYVEHDATAFCLGSFRDALWLRCKSFQARRALRLDSPLRCVFLLAILALLSGLLAFGPPSRKFFTFLSSSPGEGQFAFGCCWLYLESLLVLLTLNPRALGEYPVNCFAPGFIFRLRRWTFLAVKVALLVPVPFFVSMALMPVFPPASSITLLGWIVGLRWALADQKQRCPVCLHLLSDPVEIGDPAHSVFAPYGAEHICARGHGSLYVPRMPTSWCGTQRWQYLAPTSCGPRS